MHKSYIYTFDQIDSGDMSYTAKNDAGDLIHIRRNNDTDYMVWSDRTRKTADCGSLAAARNTFAAWIGHYVIMVDGCVIDELSGAYTDDEAALIATDRHGDVRFTIARERLDKKEIITDMVMTLTEV